MELESVDELHGAPLPAQVAVPARRTAHHAATVMAKFAGGDNVRGAGIRLVPGNAAPDQPALRISTVSEPLVTFEL
jgi:hypothetical protein